MVAGSPASQAAELEATHGRVGAALRGQVRVPRFSAIWVATALLFAVSPLLAHGSLGHSALLSMLPFAAILAIASIGQTLVVQQRGLDLSVPGMITLTTIVVTKVPNGDEHRLPAAIGLALLACTLAGLVSGVAISRLSITPLVATLGVNALLLGVVYQITSGSSTAAATPGLARFALAKTGGIPNTVLIAAGAVLVVEIVSRATLIGRRFLAVGTSPAAARAAGIRVGTYELLTYVLAGVAYCGAGILVAGFLGTPGIGAGQDYLLPTIAAVVLGGTSLAGGSGSVLATAIGALFLTQLEQVVLGMGAPSSVQLVIQGSIIALGMALRNVPWRRLELHRPFAQLAPAPAPKTPSRLRAADHDHHRGRGGSHE
ncbi:MAG TPA: ABC transporter permease [Gaiellaceae bacterium]|nr:ABC transporter permease [Gaiellaceae bacterium]